MTDHSNNLQTSGGLSAYLEDIDSDDDDSLLRDEEDKKFSKSPTPVPTGSPVNSIEDKPKTLGEKRGNSLVISQMPSKEELLMMMEKVDRDIAAAETQISALQKKQVSNNLTRDGVYDDSNLYHLSFEYSLKTNFL